MYSERMTCAIQDRLARDHPELFTPPNLVYED
jgi:hypothetical protein